MAHTGTLISITPGSVLTYLSLRHTFCPRPSEPIYESTGPTHGQEELSGMVELHLSDGAR
jgi:hypothetical protein